MLETYKTDLKGRKAIEETILARYGMKDPVLQAVSTLRVATVAGAMAAKNRCSDQSLFVGCGSCGESVEYLRIDSDDSCRSREPASHEWRENAHEP